MKIKTQKSIRKIGILETPAFIKIVEDVEKRLCENRTGVNVQQIERLKHAFDDGIYPE
ncbi:MAG: hypothetical protein GY801_53640 [bacterium]|nr:hypothetical protein [bacterium]